MPKGKAVLKGIFGEMLDNVLRVVKKSGRELDADAAIRAVGTNAKAADHIPVFKVGRTRNLRGKAAEYVRQLQRQVDGLNNMTANELLENMKTVTRGGLEQKQAREEFFQHLADKAEDKYLREGMTREAAARAAQKDAADKMSALAALHEPDIIAGGLDVINHGPDGLPSMGDRWVNSSIGSQWRSRAKALRAYAEEMKASGKGSHPLNISFLLE
ncbi:MAG: polymorphic toxin type 15 domain-containing protein [Actinomycetia bacterium]|nr:polymorphic toxin type 15 domain-containing protein [Actinomycetes bacterium]